jgi:uncharacterized protein (TIGR00661 family)
LKIAFIVQGEGRGHLTQAISLQEILETAGHEITIVLAGTNAQRKLPPFFVNHYQDKLTTYQSPNLVKDKNKKSVRLGYSLIHNILQTPLFLKQLKKIDKLINQKDIDLIINFHEILCGFWFLFYRPKAPIVSIAHQYIYPHFRFFYPKMSRFNKFSLETVNSLTTMGSKKNLAINFIQWENLSWDKLFVIPPLIRNQIKTLKTENKGHLLVYLLNPGYADQIILWHENHPDQQIHCFWDKEDVEEEFIHSKNLTFHKLNADKYIKYLATCKGLATTAGYESICEAMYLGKPVLMVPVHNHPEQLINAVQAKAAGAGIMSNFFDLHELVHFADRYKANPAFKIWVNYASELVLQELNNLDE